MWPIKEFVILFCFYYVGDGATGGHSIEKRALLFPRSTVFQLTVGISIPIILPNRTIIISPGIQNNFDLPYNLSNFQVVTYARSQDYGYDFSRDSTYDYMMAFLDSVGLNGEECLLRAVCEVAHTPFHIGDKDSLLEKIAHFVLTPSKGYTNETILPEEYDPTLNFKDKILAAEMIGRRGKRCANIYTDCLVSIVDVISQMFAV